MQNLMPVNLECYRPQIVANTVLQSDDSDPAVDGDLGHQSGKNNLSHDGLNPAHVLY